MVRLKRFDMLQPNMAASTQSNGCQSYYFQVIKNYSREFCFGRTKVLIKWCLAIGFADEKDPSQSTKEMGLVFSNHTLEYIRVSLKHEICDKVHLYKASLRR